ncbi:biotin-dependent carboxyltransferase family protein [Paenibacillus sp. J2TS4]|uniref:5-oxoprolinase subunit C family protein n=1 Tax=Paenibacillus sp. J2TS4 TaxID=2807194 RepID=UPI001B13DC78|nr:biotin-dependent carboxyltransferase family protein [Paenibacillus sp. J2TS4]GIP32477.1 KipI antagonist [Paenibacillus sp. J2TS4]
MNMKLLVQQPGLFTTVQDGGRTGLQKYGVPVGGAMDSYAFRLANILVGNDEEEAALEMTLTGPALRFESEALIAIGGGDFAPALDGEAVPAWRPVYVKGGSTLRFGRCRSGCRAYVAVAGGISVPRVLGGRGTYLRAGLGGLHGRPLQQGDALPIGAASTLSRELAGRLAAGCGSRSWAAADWYVGPDSLPPYGEAPVLRFVPGREYDEFTHQSRLDFGSFRFLVSSRSDRMGCRLEGPALSLSRPADLLSGPVTAGTVQVPPDGRPIVLMADRQTTGGYPMLAQIAAVDLPVLAQAKPGDMLAFEQISREQAESMLLLREAEWRMLKLAIRLKQQEGERISCTVLT